MLTLSSKKILEKNCNLKIDTLNKSDLERVHFIFILFILEIQK